MRVSFEWLSDFIDIKNLNPVEVADRLTMSGLEVEAVESIEGIDGIVVAEVLEKEKHPDADKLSVCKVFDGKESYQVVCGAKNVDKGQKVVFCKIGAVLPGNFKIKKAKIRGVESMGMIASLSELGLEEKSDGIYVLPPDTKFEENPNNILGLKDYVLDISITPNRADCLSVIGVAREIGALYNIPVNDKKFKVSEAGEYSLKYPFVKIEEKTLCPVYLGRVIKNVQIKPSPLWIQNRLRKAGVRPINNIVDVTNYILFEYGQPLHTFDLSQIDGGITVRKAFENEKILTLDGKEKKLEPDMLVIADNKKPLAVAGVMGGEYSGINDTTKDVFLECAYFNPDSIRLTARKLGMKTDSSYRYERGIDMKNTFEMVDYAASLLAEVSGGIVAKGVSTDNPAKYHPVKVDVEYQKINDFIGFNLSKEDQIRILENLKFRVTKNSGGYTAEVPSYRVDISIWQDIAEEIARVYGYDKIKTTIPGIIADGKVQNPLLRGIRGLKNLMAGLGFNEVINYSFVSEEMMRLFDNENKFVKLLNPISEEMTTMRTYVFPGILSAIKQNLNQGEKTLKFFEIASTYSKNQGILPDQNTSLAFGVTDNFWGLNWIKRPQIDTFYYVKGVVENIMKWLNIPFSISRSGVSFLHPGKSADIVVNDFYVGFLGELNPDIYEKLDFSESIYICELNLQKLIEASSQYSPKFKSFSAFPFVYKDISIVVSKDVFASNIQHSIENFDPLVQTCLVFDVFEDEKIGKDLKSLSFRIFFSHKDKTLTDMETNSLVEKIVVELTQKFGATLR